MNVDVTLSVDMLCEVCSAPKLYCNLTKDGRAVANGEKRQREWKGICEPKWVGYSSVSVFSHIHSCPFLFRHCALFVCTLFVCGCSCLCLCLCLRLWVMSVCVCVRAIYYISVCIMLSGVQVDFWLNGQEWELELSMRTLQCGEPGDGDDAGRRPKKKIQAPLLLNRSTRRLPSIAFVCVKLIAVALFTDGLFEGCCIVTQRSLIGVPQPARSGGREGGTSRKEEKKKRAEMGLFFPNSREPHANPCAAN